MDERNKLERTAALDRHTDSVSRWRGDLARHEDMAEIWYKGLRDKTLTEVEAARINNMYINFVNTQRSNYERAKVVGEEGLMKQATRSVAVEVSGSEHMVLLWNSTKNWQKLASPEFIAAVDKEIDQLSKAPAEIEQISWKKTVDILTKDRSNPDKE
ncbi:MAG: hypothetical protein RL839_04280 [Gammaproteobacteria bacterium]